MSNWLFLMLLYGFFGWMKKRQRDKARDKIESQDDWDTGGIVDFGEGILEAIMGDENSGVEKPKTIREEDVEEEEESSNPSEEQALENAQILQAIDGDVEPAQGAVAVGKDNSKIKVLPGGIEWDTSKHWSKRAKIALEMYGDDTSTLEAIMAVETKGVVTAIKKGIEEG